MSPAAQCRICGETRFAGQDYCPACGHPYDDEDDEGADTDDDR